MLDYLVSRIECPRSKLLNIQTSTWWHLKEHTILYYGVFVFIPRGSYLNVEGRPRYVAFDITVWQHSLLLRKEIHIYVHVNKDYFYILYYFCLKWFRSASINHVTYDVIFFRKRTKVDFIHQWIQNKYSIWYSE